MTAKKHSTLTQERLKELLHYDPETGVFTRKVRTSNRIKVGDVAGCIHHCGYSQINIDNRLYLAHRLAFLWMTGDVPAEVDHVDHDKANNRWDNLRAASRQDNMRNQPLYANNTSGVVGVYWHKAGRKWNSQIRANGRTIYLGLFENITDAVAARKEAEIQHGYHQNHGVLK